MEKFRLQDAGIPVYLYRVQYQGCQTAQSVNGLEAQDVSVTYSEDEMNAFRQSIIEQFTWGHRGAQPYIACFSDKIHAQNWACSTPWDHGGCGKDSWRLLTIDTSLIPETYVFRVNDLETRLGFKIPESASTHKRGAYLCLHLIPASAIKDSASPHKVQSGTQTAAISQGFFPVAYNSADVDERNNKQKSIAGVRDRIRPGLAKIRKQDPA